MTKIIGKVNTTRLGIYRHSWISGINYSINSCIRCKITRKKVGNSYKYYEEGKELEFNPNCKQIDGIR